jgi:WXG100 family type VII secretion target
MGRDSVTRSTIRADHDQLKTIAAQFGRQEHAVRTTLRRLQKTMEELQSGGWKGRGADSFYKEMDERLLPAFLRLEEAFSEAQKITIKIIQIAEQAEEECANLFKEILMAGAAAAAAGIAAVADAVGTRESRQERRSDRRVDRRARTDARWRRPPGGTRGGEHTDYDWAGGAILERYLTGGGDWNIKNDPNWTEYMEANPTLTRDLGSRAESDAQSLFQQYANGGSDHTSINQTYPMEIENGEGVVGYQYLHGTNANAGGFQRQGTATIEPDGSGGYNVTEDMDYTWNDIIDPNPNYATDNWKSKVAEVISLGQAESYEMHVGWSERTVVNLDSNGNVRSIHNE